MSIRALQSDPHGLMKKQSSNWALLAPRQRTLRVTAPTYFVISVGRSFSNNIEAYPEIIIDISFEDRIVDPGGRATISHCASQRARSAGTSGRPVRRLSFPDRVGIA